MKLLLKIFLVSICLLSLASKSVQAQQNLVYSHYFLNPFLYNPSFVAPNGYTELYLNYRNQWAGIEGAPATGTVSIHLPLNYKVGLALTGYQDKAGVLKTTTGLATFAYQAYLGNRLSDNHKIGFGLSAGVMSISIDPDDVYANDPVARTTSSFEGQFGMHYQLKNFKLAFAIPRLLKTYVASEQDFRKLGFEQIKTTITSVSYNIKLSNRIAFEPIATYRTYENTDGQYEGMGVLRLDTLAWIGGSYRQNYGATAFVGVNIKDKLKLGYAYEFAVDQINTFGDGTHEIQLVLPLGKKKPGRPQAKEKGQVKQGPMKNSVSEQVEQEEAIAEEDVEPKEAVVKEGVQSDEATKSKEVPQNEAVVKEEIQANETVIEEEIAEDLPEESPQEEIAQRPVVEPSLAPVENKSQETRESPSGNDLQPGYYVVVGAFHVEENARNFKQTLQQSGYPADVAFHPDKDYFIVYLVSTPTFDEARQTREKYRQNSVRFFRESWILNIKN